MTCTCPGEVTVITPPQLHMHCDVSSSALTPLILTRAEPGAQGIRTGTQAATPVARVAGLIGDEHMTKVGMFAGVMSVITPAGVVAETSTLEAVKTAGADPNVHTTTAPVETWIVTVPPQLLFS